MTRDAVGAIESLAGALVYTVAFVLVFWRLTNTVKRMLAKKAKDKQANSAPKAT